MKIQTIQGISLNKNPSKCNSLILRSLYIQIKKLMRNNPKISHSAIEVLHQILKLLKAFI